MVSGPAELLRMGAPGAVHYLVRRSPQPWLDLSARRYLRESVTGAQLVTDANNYAGQLGIYFGDCPAAAEAAQAAPFTLAGLARVVQTFNETCSGARQPGRSWLNQAAPRRRLAWQSGLLAGARYNRLASSAHLDEYEFLDDRLRPTAGLFAEVLLPGRSSSVYGELSIGRFQGRHTLHRMSSSGQVGYIDYSYAYADYAAWLGTARIGVRRYAPLRGDQHLVLGLSYELGRVLRPRFSTLTTGSSTGPTTTEAAPDGLTAETLSFARQTLLPALTLGWRARRLTLTLDGQRCGDDRLDGGGLGALVVGTARSARLSASYRLGRSHDQPDAGR